MGLFPKVFQNSLVDILVRLESGTHIPVAHTFRFEQAWCLADNFGDLIRDWWNLPQPQGCGAFTLSKKLSLTRERIKHWAKHDFGSIKLKKLALLNELEGLEVTNEGRPLSYEDFTLEMSLRQELDKIFK